MDGIRMYVSIDVDIDGRMGGTAYTTIAIRRLTAHRILFLFTGVII